MRSYAERYWEMFNELDGDFDEVVITSLRTWFEKVLDRETGHQLATTNR